MGIKRYTYTNIISSLTRNAQVYKPTLYPNIPIEDDDIFITSKGGDRLDNLAYKYYKDPSYWWIIARANHFEDGKFSLKAGIEVRIPADLNNVLVLLEEKNKLM